MAVNKNGNPRPDGVSVGIPLGPVGVGGTWYWNPGSPTAPSVTLTGGLGMGGGGIQTVFLRKGRTSNDTLGYGLTGTASTGFPSATVNASVPDVNGIPQPWKAGVSSVETGLALPGFGATYTATPEQIGHFVGGLHYVQPAMGPDDELSPFARTLQSGAGTVGAADDSDRAIRYVGSRYQDPLGDGMEGWSSSASASPQPPPPQQPDRPGGLLGLLMDQLQNR